MLVSVIIPIYNVEKYLDRCIESVIHQTYQNLEIILVDDGSPDACPQMCDAWAKKDTRIKVIHKENAGLGFARNSGLDAATGDAVCFIDSDDYVLPTMIEDAVEQMQAEQAEIVCYGMQKVGKDGTVTKMMVPCTSQKTYRGDEVRTSFLEEWATPNPATRQRRNILMSVCSAMFLKKAIDRVNWRLVSERDIISEDIYSRLALYASIQSVTILPVAYYCYCTNENSLTMRYRADRYEKIVDFYKRTAMLCEQLGYSQVVIEALKLLFFSFTMAAFKMIQETNELTPKEKRNLIKKICNDETMQVLVSDYHDTTISKAQQIFWKLVKYKCYAGVNLFLVVKCRRLK